MLSLVSPGFSRPGPNTLFREVVADQQVTNMIADSLLNGELAADQDKGPYQLAIHQGMLAFLKSVEALGLNLFGELGWERREKDNHARFYSPPGLYSEQVCVTYCRGVLVRCGDTGDYFRIRPKGIRWKELLDDNRIRAQLALPLSVGPTAVVGPHTICALASLEGTYLRIYLADPLELVKVKGQSQTMQLWVSDWACIFEGDLTGFQSGTLQGGELEPPVDQDFDLEENEDEASSG